MTTTDTTLTPSQRLQAAHAAHLAWRAPEHLELWEEQYARADHHGMAFAGLIGYLRSLLDHDEATPERIAAAVEKAVRFAAPPTQVHVTGAVADVLLGGAK